MGNCFYTLGCGKTTPYPTIALEALVEDTYSWEMAMMERWPPRVLFAYLNVPPSFAKVRLHILAREILYYLSKNLMVFIQHESKQA